MTTSIDVQDQVRNRITKIDGTVNAKYLDNGKMKIDVLLLGAPTEEGRNIWNASPIENWELTCKYEGGGAI